MCVRGCARMRACDILDAIGWSEMLFFLEIFTSDRTLSSVVEETY